MLKSGGLWSFSKQLCCELGIRENLNVESALLRIQIQRELGGGR